MIGTRQSPRRRSQGFLMIVYGFLMLVAGAAMLGRLLPTMQAPDVSGAAMIGVGLAMLYVGATMRRAHMSFRCARERAGLLYTLYPTHRHLPPPVPNFAGGPMRSLAGLP